MNRYQLLVLVEGDPAGAALSVEPCHGPVGQSRSSSSMRRVVLRLPTGARVQPNNYRSATV
jgi:hypothetical protein